MMSTFLRIAFAGTMFATCFFWANSCSTHPVASGEKSALAGRYEKENGSEMLELKSDQSFLCRRLREHQFDVIIPMCEIIAEGRWERKNGFIVLRNKESFNDLEYSITESTAKNQDSFYFKVILPQEDALNFKIFKFILNTNESSRLYNEFDGPDFSFKKPPNLFSFGLSVKNVAPVSAPGKKSYQRNYFSFFESYRPKSASANLFIITLKSFNQCFYEAFDVEGDILGILNEDLLWRGSVYKRTQ